MNNLKEEAPDQKYKMRIAELQSRRTPIGSVHLYEGFWHTKMFLEGIMHVQDNFCAKPTDILLTSAPKTGTTWLKSLLYAIVTRTRYDISMSPLLTAMPHNRVPYIEVELVSNSLFESDLELHTLSTHMPYSSLPRSIITLDCKMVYIYRDPKDVFVSMWHFWCKIKNEPLDLHECFMLFMKGTVFYGPFWDHVLSYWEVSLERPDKILMLTYEDLLTDTQFYVKKLAEFVDVPFSMEEEEQGVVEKIVNLCSFDNLSNLDVNKLGKYHIHSNFSTLDNNIFFRKGKIGDWKSYLTTEMAEEIDNMTEKKFSGTGLMVPSKIADR